MSVESSASPNKRTTAGRKNTGAAKGVIGKILKVFLDIV
jgi:hypothetical protein